MIQQPLPRHHNQPDGISQVVDRPCSFWIVGNTSDQNHVPVVTQERLENEFQPISKRFAVFSICKSRVFISLAITVNSRKRHRFRFRFVVRPLLRHEPSPLPTSTIRQKAHRALTSRTADLQLRAKPGSTVQSVSSIPGCNAAQDPIPSTASPPTKTPHPNATHIQQ